MNTRVITKSHVEGDLRFNGLLKFEVPCYVTGRIEARSIKADRSIRSGGNIEAMGNIEAGGYIKTEWAIIAGGNIIAGGYIEAGGNIEADRSIRSGGYIEAGGNIEAGGYIKTEWAIIAGGNIIAGGYIKSGGSIAAGENIEACGYIFSLVFSVFAKYIVSKSLPFWRKYWADMPPLKKWRELILDASKCWDDYRKAVTPAQAKKICAWNGWHWILRAQLEMFFGLKDKVVPLKEKK